MSIPPGSTALALPVPSLVHQRVFEGNIGLDFPLCTSDDVDPEASPQASEQHPPRLHSLAGPNALPVRRIHCQALRKFQKQAELQTCLFAARLDQT